MCRAVLLPAFCSSAAAVGALLEGAALGTIGALVVLLGSATGGEFIYFQF